MQYKLGLNKLFTISSLICSSIFFSQQSQEDKTVAESNYRYLDIEKSFMISIETSINPVEIKELKKTNEIYFSKKIEDILQKRAIIKPIPLWS